jgi:peptidoglycan/xylan/chitin deacetylase (PgdA/CDA1 family)
MKIIKKFFFIISLYSGFNYLASLYFKRRLFLVGYHSISNKIYPSYSHLTVSLSMFESHIRYMQKRGHTFIQFKDLDTLDWNTIQKPTIVYFDDGFKDNYLELLPLCLNLGIPITVFIVPSYADNFTDIYMNWDEIKILKSNNVEIGSHTFSHSVLTEEDDEKVISELITSKERISKETGGDVSVLSYPKGRFSDSVVKLVESSGYKYAVTTKYGLNKLAGVSSMPYTLKKVAPRVYESLNEFKVRLYSYNIFR